MCTGHSQDSGQTHCPKSQLVPLHSPFLFLPPPSPPQFLATTDLLSLFSNLHFLTFYINRLNSMPFFIYYNFFQFSITVDGACIARSLLFIVEQYSSVQRPWFTYSFACRIFWLVSSCFGYYR